LEPDFVFEDFVYIFDTVYEHWCGINTNTCTLPC